MADLQTIKYGAVTFTIPNPKGLEITPVSALPATGEAGRLYIVPAQTPGTSDLYDEYIWHNDAWERWGSATIDLNGYATEAFVTDTTGILSNLSTEAKTNLVAAINELKNSIGDLSALQTTAKTSVVAAINELVGDGSCEDYTLSIEQRPISGVQKWCFVLTDGAGNEQVQVAPDEWSQGGSSGGTFEMSFLQQFGNLSNTTYDVNVADLSDYDMFIIRTNGDGGMTTVLTTTDGVTHGGRAFTTNGAGAVSQYWFSLNVLLNVSTKKLTVVQLQANGWPIADLNVALYGVKLGGGSGVPAGGTTGQSLVKRSDADGDVTWSEVSGLPDGGSAGQALVKASDADGDVTWMTGAAGTPVKMSYDKVNDRLKIDEQELSITPDAEVLYNQNAIKLIKHGKVYTLQINGATAEQFNSAIPTIIQRVPSGTSYWLGIVGIGRARYIGYLVTSSSQIAIYKFPTYGSGAASLALTDQFYIYATWVRDF